MEVDGPLYPGDFYRPPPDLLACLEPVPRAAWSAPNADRPPTPFYTAFRRLALVCKWAGCLPVTTSASSSQLAFSWRSPATLVTLGWPIIDIAYMIWSYDMYRLENAMMLGVTMVNFTLSYSIRLLFITNIPLLIELIQLFEELHDTDLFKETDSKCASNNINLIITSIVLFLIVMLLQPLSLQTKVLLFNCASSPTFICCLLWAVCHHLASLWDRLERAVARLTDRRRPEPLIEHHRIAHVRLITCVRIVNRVFGNWLAIVYILFHITFLQECFKFVYGLGGDLVIALAFLPFTYYPAIVIHRFQEKNKMILEHLFKMSLNPCSENELFQIVYFQRQVEINEATVSAAGLAEVNKEIIPKVNQVLSLFATCFIAAVQILPQIQAVTNVWEHQVALEH